MLVSIDPSIIACACAESLDLATISGISLIPNPIRDFRKTDSREINDAIDAMVSAVLNRYPKLTHLVLEKPKIYTGIAAVSAVENDVHILLSLVREFEKQAKKLGISVTVYLPGEWKGQMPKKATSMWVQRRLSPKERLLLQDILKQVVSVGGKGTEDLIEAVGIFMHHAKRTRNR